MIWRIFQRRIINPTAVFNGPFFDVRTLYVIEYDRMPSISAIGEVDGGSVYAFVKERLGASIINVWQHSYYDFQEGGVVFSRSVFQLGGNRMIEVGAEYCEVLHHGDFGWANELITALAHFRLRPKEAPIGFARTGNLN